MHLDTVHLPGNRGHHRLLDWCRSLFHLQPIITVYQQPTHPKTQATRDPYYCRFQKSTARKEGGKALWLLRTKSRDRSQAPRLEKKWFVIAEHRRGGRFGYLGQLGQENDRDRKSVAL